MFKVAFLLIAGLLASTNARSVAGEGKRGYSHPDTDMLSVCGSMSVSHERSTARTDPMPITVSVSKKEVSPNEEIEITLAGQAFKGYFVQVRDGDETPVGSFQKQDKVRTLSCNNRTASAALLVGRQEIDSATLKYQAPSTPGEYKVYVTLVKNFGTFWERVPTETIKVLEA